VPPSPGVAHAALYLLEFSMRGETDTILDALERAAPFFDAGYSPASRRLRPSAITQIRYCVLMSQNNEAAHDHARAMAAAWLAEGRKRWRAGFSANPLPAEPVPR
jgi:hypothetical protein